MISIQVLLFLLVSWSACVDGGHVLVFPGEYSHWLNMRNIIEGLVERNHSVTVLVSTGSPSVNYNKTEKFAFQVFQVPYSKEELHAVTEDFIHSWMYEFQNASMLHIGQKIKEWMDKSTVLQHAQCDAMLRNKDLLTTLRKAKFDAVLTDPMMMCTDLVADLLDLPLIISLRMSLGYVMERSCGQMPAPPSYVPCPSLPYTDRMTFYQRVVNMVTHMFHTALLKMHWHLYLSHYYNEIRGKPTTFCELFGKADIWLIRTYWDFDFPRPFVPNFKFVGGLHCKPAKPLPDDMEEFVQSSGDDGIVVFSLGTMVKNMTKERSNTIASALGQIPQKVLWRYSGERPDTLAPNTRMYDWLPQNDLLGHSKTKAFIAHGGTNGLYEAIYHGVPIMGIPLIGDQSGNINHLVTKGAALMVDFHMMTSQDLADGLKAVINEPSYKENMMRLSRIHHDQPMTPLETAVFWIEYVMRHKGAKHLRVQSHNLNWIQYYSLDVLATLLATVLLFVYVFIKTCSFCIRKCCTKSSRPREKTD